MLKILVACILLAICILIPLNYYTLVKYAVTGVYSGWVFGTLFIRFLVIVFFALSLNLWFSFFERAKRIKFYRVLLLSIIPGFVIGFITPIYNTDYGDFSDNMLLEHIDSLESISHGAYHPGGEKHIVGFFSTSCGHCQNVAAKIGLNIMAGQKLDVHAFFLEPKEEIEHFLMANNGQDFHSYQILDPNTFMSISGFELPSIFLIDKDGKTLKHWKGDVINYSALDEFLEMEP